MSDSGTVNFFHLMDGTIPFSSQRQSIMGLSLSALSSLSNLIDQMNLHSVPIIRDVWMYAHRAFKVQPQRCGLLIEKVYRSWSGEGSKTWKGFDG